MRIVWFLSSVNKFCNQLIFSELRINHELKKLPANKFSDGHFPKFTENEKLEINESEGSERTAFFELKLDPER